MIAIEDESDETENTFGLSVKRNFLMELYSNISGVIFLFNFFLLKYYRRTVCVQETGQMCLLLSAMTLSMPSQTTSGS